MRNLRNILISAGIGLMLPFLALAARTNDLWVYPTGTTYIEPNFNSGLDILLNGANHYINFNSVTGTSGYGLRDNSGTIEFKNTGGSWQAVGTGGTGGSPSGSPGYIQYYGTGGIFSGTPTTTLQAGSGITLSGTPVILGSSPITITSTGGGGGTGTVSTSTVPTLGQIPYWTSNGTPSTLGSIATGTATFSSPLTGGPFTIIGTGGSIGCQTASGSQAGCLSSTDWNTFNNKNGWAWPFPSNATSTTLTFSNGLLSTASSTFTGTLNTTFPYGLYQDGSRILFSSSTAGILSAGYLSGTAFGTSTNAFGDINGNTAFGYRALQLSTSSAEQTAVGAEALANFIGSDTGPTAAGNNTAVGFKTLYKTTTGYSNTAIGDDALASNTTGDHNTGIGVYSLFTNTTGTSNTGLGENTLQSNTTGSENTAVGGQSMYYNTTGAQNTAIGRYSLVNLTSGGSNVAVGYQAMKNNTTGSSSVAVGRDALFNNVSPTSTVSIGYASGFGASGYNNQGGVFVGYAAGNSVQTGSDWNTLIGNRSGQGITTGSKNILIGASNVSGSQSQVTTGSQNISIGYNAQVADPTLSGQLNIGNFIYGTGLTGTGSTVSNGLFGIGTTSPFAKLSVAGNGYIGGNLTATGTLALIPLGTPAGSLLAVDPSGNVIATTSSSGGVASVSGTYPVQSTGGTNPAISLAFGTTTNNTWGGTQTFTNAPKLAALTGLIAGNGGATYAAATSSLACTSASGVTCTTTGVVGPASTIALSAIPNSSLANSTISGVALGSNLANLTALDTTLSFAGGYNGSIARTIALNLFNGNIWTAASTTFTGGVTIGTATTTAATTTAFAISGISGSTQCLHVNSSGTVSGTGSDCGSGSGAVSSVSNSDGTLTVSPTTGAVVASLALGHANVWTGQQTFGNASSTLFSTSYASSTQYFGANLAACNGGSNALTWNNGTFGCNTISAGSSASTTLLTDNNTFSGTNTFTTATTSMTHGLSISGGGLKVGTIAALSGNNCLQVDASGSISNTGSACGAGGGGTPGGASSTVQYNANGSFSGNSGFTYDGTNVGIGTSTPNQGLTIGSTTAAYNYEYQVPYSTSMTVSWNNSDNQLVRVSGTSATSITFSGGYPGQSLRLGYCNNSGSTDGALTFGNIVHGSGGIQPSNTTAMPGACDYFSFYASMATSTLDYIYEGSLPGVE